MSEGPNRAGLPDVARGTGLGRCLLLAGCIPAVWAHSNPDEEQLQAANAAKIITLRHSHEDEQLSFGADGTLKGEAEVGPWTLDWS